MNSKITAVVAASIVLAGCGGGPAKDGGKISGDEVKLGVLTDLSGVYSSVTGKKAVAAVEMAVEDYKAKYDDKAVAKKVTVVSGDHQNKPDVASTQARQMYERDGVDAIFDVPTSSAALAVSTLAAQFKKMHFNVGAAAQELTGKNCNKYTYGWAYDGYMIAKGTGTAVTKAGGKDWYLLYPDYVFGQGLQAAFTGMIKSAGGTVVASDPTPFPASDFSTFLLKVQAKKPAILGAMHAGGDLSNLVKQYNQYKLREKGIKLAVGLIFDAEIKAMGAESLQGTQFTTAWFWGMDEQSKAWAEKFKAKTGEYPNFDQAGNYSAATQYLEAIQRTGTDKSDDVVKSLDGMTFSDMFARNATIRAGDHRVIHDAYLAEVRKPSEVTNPDDLTKLVTTLPAAEAFEPVSPDCKMS